MRWKLLLSCFGWLMTEMTEAQVYSFISYTPRDGLVNSRVKSAFQDSRGRMYFITYGGLSIYDGNRFINYSQNNGLCNNVVNDVFEAAPDSILVAVNTQNLNAWVNGHMDTLHTRDGYCPTINKFLKSVDGHLYVIADEGLYVFANRVFTKLPLQYASEGNDIHYLSSIIEYNNYFLISTWAGSEKARLLLYDKKTGRVTDVNTRSESYSLVQNKYTRQILVTTKEGIMVLDSNSLMNGKILLTEFHVAGLPGGVYQAVFNNENQLCFFNNAALVIPRVSGNYTSIIATNGLPVNNILDVFIDREDNKWIITDGSGILKLADTRIGAINQLDDGKKINAIAMDFDSSGLWFYDKLSARLIRYDDERFSGFNLPLSVIDYGILLKGENVFCINEHKVFFLKKKEMNIGNLHLVCTLDNPALFPGRPVSDAHGYLHMNTWGKENSSVLSISPEGKKYVYPLGNYVDEIAVDNQDHVWVISRGTPLQSYLISPGPDSCLRFIHDYKNELPPIAARSITLDNAGHVIIGSRDQGIFILNFRGTRLLSVKNISVKDGLTDDFIYSVACDKFNNIWVGSQSGLDILHPDGQGFFVDNITRNNNIFETILSIKTNAAGDGFARCIEGNILHVINLANNMPAAEPELFVSSVLVNDKPVYPRSSSLQLSHSENSISFSVAAPSFFDEHAVLYSYRLQGSNNNWSTPSHQSVFNFLNLFPGHYTLHVRAVFPAHRHADKEMSYSFFIRPAWYQTWLFRIIAGLLAIGMMIAGIRFYYRRRLERERTLLEKQQAVEKERTRIAMDMHDDLGAGLSRIKFLSETIGIKKQQQQPIEEDIGKIREYSHDMIDKMGEIVWALNEKNDTLSDLLAYTRAYATEYLMQNGIALSVQLPDVFPEKFVTGEFRRNIFLTVKEALHNVVKHAAATRVSMDIRIGQQLAITLADNGTGLDETKLRPFSSGMMNMKNRIAEIGGTLKIETNKGTLVHLSVPL